MKKYNPCFATNVSNKTNNFLSNNNDFQEMFINNELIT